MNECLTTLNQAKVSTLIDCGSVGAVNVRTKVSTLIDGGSVGAVNVRTKVSTLIDDGSVGAVNVRTKVSTLIDGGSVGALNVRTKVSTLIDGGSVGALNVRTKVSTLIDGGSSSPIAHPHHQRPQWGCGSWCHLWIQGNPWNCQHSVHGMKEGNVLFNDALNTFYLRLYRIIHMVKDY